MLTATDDLRFYLILLKKQVICEPCEPSTSALKWPAPDTDYEDDVPKPKKASPECHMSSLVTKTSIKTSVALDIQSARYFYSCNITFNVAEQREFLSMVTALRPGYSPPSRKALVWTTARPSP